jgi:hypothetical protein
MMTFGSKIKATRKKLERAMRRRKNSIAKMSHFAVRAPTTEWLRQSGCSALIGRQIHHFCEES